MGGSNCQLNQCVCPKAMTAQNGICTLVTGNLGPCTDNTQCTGGAFCDPIRQLCLCPGIFLCKILFIILASQIAIGGVCIKVFNKRSLTSLNEEENQRFFAKQFNDQASFQHIFDGSLSLKDPTSLLSQNISCAQDEDCLRMCAFCKCIWNELSQIGFCQQILASNFTNLRMNYTKNSKFF